MSLARNDEAQAVFVDLMERALAVSGLPVVSAAELAAWNREKNRQAMLERDVKPTGWNFDDDQASLDFYVHDPEGRHFALYRKLTVYLDKGRAYELFVEDGDGNEVWTPGIERMKQLVVNI